MRDGSKACHWELPTIPLVEQLYDRGHLNDYIDRINDRQEIGTLLKNVFGDDWANIKTQDNRSIFPAQLQKWTDNQITELRPMIRNGMGQLSEGVTSISQLLTRYRS